MLSLPILGRPHHQWVRVAFPPGSSIPATVPQGVFGVPEARLYWMLDLGIFNKGTRLGESDRVLE
jgi:hypothetical protein